MLLWTTDVTRIVVDATFPDYRKSFKMLPDTILFVGAVCPPELVEGLTGGLS